MLKKLFAFSSFLWLVPSLCRAQTNLLERKLFLNDCYQLALQKDESIRIQSQNIIQADENRKEALSAVLPKIQFNYSHFFQDTSGVDGGGSGVGGTLTRRDRPEAKFSGRQIIFSGLRETAAISSLKSISQKETLLLKTRGRILFQEVAQAFYAVLQAEKDLNTVQTIIDLMQERIRELGSRVQLGKSRASELLSVESQFAALTAQQEKTTAEASNARNSLARLLEIEVHENQLIDEATPSQNLETLEIYLQRAASRTDIEALKKELESKRAQMKMARGGFFPTVSVSGNYFAKRVGFQEPIDWDFLVNADVPIFHGGKNLSAIRKAASEFKASELELRSKLKEAEWEVKKNYIAYSSSIQQAKILEQAFKKAQISYEFHAREYRMGLVNNLEVLEAMNRMQEIRSSLDRTIIQAKLNYLELKISTDEVPLP